MSTWGDPFTTYYDSYGFETEADDFWAESEAIGALEYETRTIVGQTSSETANEITVTSQFQTNTHTLYYDLSWSGDNLGDWGGYDFEANYDDPVLYAGDTSMPAEHDCSVTESGVDTEAERIRALILANADHNQREYGAVIYRDSEGVIRSTGLVSGPTFAELEADQQRGDNTIRPGISSFGDLNSIVAAGGELLAFIHNHPATPSTYDNPADMDILNQNPSDTDWATFDLLDQNGMPSGDNRSHGFSQYVIDSNGDMREFNASDRATHDSTNSPDTPDQNNDVRNPTHCV